jgi:hypothetical protein
MIVQQKRDSYPQIYAAAAEYMLLPMLKTIAFPLTSSIVPLKFGKFTKLPHTLPPQSYNNSRFIPPQYDHHSRRDEDARWQQFLSLCHVFRAQNFYLDVQPSGKAKKKDVLADTRRRLSAKNHSSVVDHSWNAVEMERNSQLSDASPSSEYHTIELGGISTRR